MSRLTLRGGALRIAPSLLFVLVAAAGRTGCRGTLPSASTPSPTRSPAYPAAKPRATALENLPLIRSLEQASGRSTILIGLEGSGILQDGRVSEGSGWDYYFSETIGGIPRIYQWTVYETGAIRLLGPLAPIAHWDFTEIGPVIRLDSDAAIAAGRRYGAQPFVDRYPGTLVRGALRFQGLVPTWELHFGELPPEGPLCQIVVFLDAQNGDSLAQDLSCLQQLNREGELHVH